MNANSVNSNSAFSSFVKSAAKTGGKGKSKAPNAEKPNEGVSVWANAPKNEAKKLSAKAEAYLAKLQKKFGNVNFILTQGEATGNEYAGSSTKGYNCFISMDLLEQMAAEESVAEKYEGVIADAIVQVDDLKKQVEDEGLSGLVKNYGIKIGADGVVSYSVLLNEGLRDLYSNKDAPDSKRVSSETKDGLLEILKEIQQKREEKAEKTETYDKNGKKKSSSKYNTDILDSVKTQNKNNKNRRDVRNPDGIRA